MEPEDGDLGQGRGEGEGRGQGYKARVPRARGRLDWSMICIATTTPDRNSTKERPVAATLALLQIRLALWPGTFVRLGNNKPRRRKYCRCKKFQT
jgi:hypothetical protein